MTLYVAKTGEVVSLQMTGAAPYAATPDKFKSKRDQEAGFLAGVVPGNFGGWIYLLDKYGTMPLWPTCSPRPSSTPTRVSRSTATSAKRSATRGRTSRSSRRRRRCSCRTARCRRRASGWSRRTSPRRSAASSPSEAGARKAGKTRGQALMAAYDFFYKGELAQEFVAFYKENDGLFTLKDFADYQPVWAKPIRTHLQGLRGLQQRPDLARRHPDADEPQPARVLRPEGDGAEQRGVHPPAGRVDQARQRRRLPLRRRPEGRRRCRSTACCRRPTRPSAGS